MTPEIEYKWLEGDDTACWRAIRGTALRSDPTAFVDEISSFERRTDSELGHWLKSHRTFVGMVGPDPVACISWYQETSPAEVHRGHLTSLFVQPEYRRAGLADSLIKRIKADAAIKILQLELEVVSTAKIAVALYARHGFQTIGRIPRATFHDGTYFEHLAMMCPLDA